MATNLLPGAAGVNPSESPLLTIFAWISLSVAFVCALFIAIDELRRPQKMAIMNVVWPVSALYFSVFAVWAYMKWGKNKPKKSIADEKPHENNRPQELAKQQNPSPTVSQIAIGTSHCGAGCAIADVLTEFAIAAAGITLLGSVLWAEYILDFAAAWALGILFQYFAIAPMRNLSLRQGILAAVQADTLSILAFQIGMYAWMALVHFVFFPHPHLTPFDPRYWLMMQAGMICGFATSFPMNRFLIRAGLKEAM